MALRGMNRNSHRQHIEQYAIDRENAPANVSRLSAKPSLPLSIKAYEICSGTTHQRSNFA
jgi:hypothetical protein